VNPEQSGLGVSSEVVQVQLCRERFGDRGFLEDVFLPGCTNGLVGSRPAFCHSSAMRRRS